MKMKLFAASLTALSMMPFMASGKSININPMITGLNSSYVTLEDASLSDQPFSSKRTPGRMFFYGTYHYSNEPWVLLSPDGKKEIEPVVSSLNTLDLGFSWLLGDDMQLSINSFASAVGVAKKYGGDNNIHGGDSRIQFKYRFLTTPYWSMAIAPELTLPSGVEYVGNRLGASTSNSSYAPGARLIGEYRTRENQWTFNLGYTYYNEAEFKFPDRKYPRIDGRSRVFVGTGWLTRLSRHWAIDSELSMQIPASQNHFTPPGLMTWGARYQPRQTVSWHFGAGTGTLGGPGGNDPLLYAGVKVPFFGKSDSKSNPSEDFGDPLLQEAYRKSLIDNADDNKPINPLDLAPLLNNPVDADTGKPLYTEDELTKKVIYQKEKIRVLDEIEFDLNMSHLTPRGRQIVQQVAKVILANKDNIQHVHIEGHTDHLGTNEVNQPLSQARAETVVKELSSRGVPSEILSAQGYGSQRPIYNKNTSARSVWQKNRRVEFNITQKE
jgi:outer membrane protein OmpA-like peptidoglycan-associated protein